MPAGLRSHRKAEQIVREEMDAIGCLEMLMPVIAPAELWQKSGRYGDRRAVQAPGPARRGDGAGHDPRGGHHLPHGPGRPLLPRPAADGVPHPDQGAGRAAPARGGPAHARVHHEGRLLVRPRPGGPGAPPTTSRPGPTTGSSTAPGWSGTGWSPTWGRWAASGRTSTWRPARRARTTWRSPTPGTRPTWRSPPPRPSRSRACPGRSSAPERLTPPGPGPSTRSAPRSTCPPAR